MVGRIFVLMEIRNPIYSGSRGFRHRRDETKKSIKNILSTYECVCVCLWRVGQHILERVQIYFLFFFNVSPRHSALWFQHHSNHDTHARPLPPWWTPIQSAMEKFIRLLKSFYIIRVKARGPNAPRQAILPSFFIIITQQWTKIVAWLNNNQLQ